MVSPWVSLEEFWVVSLCKQSSLCSHISPFINRWGQKAPFPLELLNHLEFWVNSFMQMNSSVAILPRDHQQMGAKNSLLFRASGHMAYITKKYDSSSRARLLRAVWHNSCTSGWSLLPHLLFLFSCTLNLQSFNKRRILSLCGLCEGFSLEHNVNNRFLFLLYLTIKAF